MHRLVWSGPLAAVLLIVGLFESNIDTDASDGAITSWLAGHGNTAWLAHASASVIAAVLLVVFGQALRDRLGRDTSAGALVASFATVAAAMVAVGAAVFAAVPVGRVFESAPDPDPSTYRYLSSAAASVMVIFVAPACAALAGVTGVAGMRAGTLPRWLGIASVVLAVLMLATAFVAPLMVFVLWLVVTGTAVGVRRTAVAPAHTLAGA